MLGNVRHRISQLMDDCTSANTEKHMFESTLRFSGPEVCVCTIFRFQGLSIVLLTLNLHKIAEIISFYHSHENNKIREHKLCRIKKKMHSIENKHEIKNQDIIIMYTHTLSAMQVYICKAEIDLLHINTLITTKEGC